MAALLVMFNGCIAVLLQSSEYKPADCRVSIIHNSQQPSIIQKITTKTIPKSTIDRPSNCSQFHHHPRIKKFQQKSVAMNHPIQKWLMTIDILQILDILYIQFQQKSMNHSWKSQVFWRRYCRAWPICASPHWKRCTSNITWNTCCRMKRRP